MVFSMVFSESDSTEDLQHRVVSETGMVEIGIYRVLFGHRVRAGFCGSLCCHLDWCGGDDWASVQVLYSYAVSIMSGIPEGRGCFDTVPATSSRKPFFRDVNFCAALAVLCPEPQVFRLAKPPHGP